VQFYTGKKFEELPSAAPINRIWVLLNSVANFKEALILIFIRLLFTLISVFLYIINLYISINIANSFQD